MWRIGERAVLRGWMEERDDVVPVTACIFNIIMSIEQQTTISYNML